MGWTEIIFYGFWLWLIVAISFSRTIDQFVSLLGYYFVAWMLIGVGYWLVVRVLTIGIW